MTQVVAGKNKDTFIVLFVIKIIEFFLFYVRNIFLVGSAMFISLTLVIILTFYQDALSINPINSALLFLDKIPIIGNMTEVLKGDIHMEGADISHFFLRASFYLTILTEIFRHIKMYVFKKEDKSTMKSLYKRITFVLVGIGISYSFSCLYVIMSTGGEDVIGALIVFMILGVICCVSSIIFLLVDFVAKNLHKMIDRINARVINSVE